MLTDVLWGDKDNQQALHVLSWDRVCQPKHCGGLGLRRTADTNQILLAKLAWRLLKHPTSMWSELLTSKYGSLTLPSIRSPSSTKSIVWRGVLVGYTLLHKGLRRFDAAQVTDELWWNASPNGIFTTKSAYNLLRPDIVADDCFNWKELWRFKGPTRGSLLLLVVSHDRLKT